jgi:phenylpyruvate tautomerase PptA (4-oxalocrotonate tautomerase family)
MPIVDVEVVSGGLPAGLAQALADAAGSVFGSSPGQTWVRLYALPPASYAENGGDMLPDAAPVFVTVTKRALPPRTSLVQEIDALTHAIAAVVGRPAHRIHVQYAPGAAGRMAFGGMLVE